MTKDKDGIKELRRYAKHLIVEALHKKGHKLKDFKAKEIKNIVSELLRAAAEG